MRKPVTVYTIIHSFCVTYFPPICGGWTQSIHEQTVSLGSMPYSCLFDSDTVVLRPRLDLLVCVGWRHIIVTTNSITGQVVWLLLAFVEEQEVYHLHAAVLHTPTLSEITLHVKSCHTYWDKTVAWLVLEESSEPLPIWLVKSTSAMMEINTFFNNNRSHKNIKTYSMSLYTFWLPCLWLSTPSPLILLLKV